MIRRPRLAGAGAAHSVRGTRRRRPARANPRSFSRAAVASFGGSGPYQMVGGLRPAAARRSGPGQANTFASLQMIQERWASSPRRALVTAGISIAVCGSAGGLCVTGVTIATMRSPSRRVAATSAQGRFLIPSSAPRRMIVRPQIAIREQPADPRREGHFAWSSASRCSYPGPTSLASSAAMSSSVRSSARTARRSRARKRSYSSYERTTLRGRPCLVISTGWLKRAVERFADPILEFARAERDRRHDKSPFSPK